MIKSRKKTDTVPVIKRLIGARKAIMATMYSLLMFGALVFLGNYVKDAKSENNIMAAATSDHIFRQDPPQVEQVSNIDLERDGYYLNEQNKLEKRDRHIDSVVKEDIKAEQIKEIKLDSVVCTAKSNNFKKSHQCQKTHHFKVPVSDNENIGNGTTAELPSKADIDSISNLPADTIVYVKVDEGELMPIVSESKSTDAPSLGQEETEKPFTEEAFVRNNVNENNTDPQTQDVTSQDDTLETQAEQLKQTNPALYKYIWNQAAQHVNASATSLNF